MSVLVVDYGMSNLGSICRALEECGADVLVSENPLDAQRWNRIVLPGVGSFADGMRNLEQSGWSDALRRAVKEDGVPLLGICLGMQILASKGFEGGEVEGLGLVPGKGRPVAARGYDNTDSPHGLELSLSAISHNPL